MGRRRRIEQKGMFFHVIQRGNNREYIFQENIDKGYLLKLFKQYKEGMAYKVHGFVVMDNHYHFIIQTMEEKLQTIMHQINSQYSHYYNKRYERIGHVFQGRYKAYVIENERYLLRLLRYIHQNPMRAQMVKNAWEYKWSSDVFYRTNVQNALVDVEFIFSLLAPERRQGVIEYASYIDRSGMETLEELEEVACTEEDIQYLPVNIIEDKREIRGLDDILRGTGISKQQYQLIKNGSRKRELMPYKAAYIKAALKRGYAMREIGCNIKINCSAVHHLISK